MEKVDNFEVVRQEIDRLPHWRVQLYPLAYDPNRVHPNIKLKDLIERSRVSLRGWDFPYVPHREADEVYVKNSYWAKCKFDYITETWRFTSSGQFAGLFQLREIASAYKEKLNLGGFDAGENFIDFTNQIYCVTEFFEFASRLARNADFLEGINISLKLKHVSDFKLGTTDVRRIISRSFVNKNDEIDLTKSYSYQEIVERPQGIALQTIREFFAYFGAGSIRADIIQHAQKELYSMSLGKDRLNVETMEWDK